MLSFKDLLISCYCFRSDHRKLLMLYEEGLHFKDSKITKESKIESFNSRQGCGVGVFLFRSRSLSLFFYLRLGLHNFFYRRISNQYL